MTCDQAQELITGLVDDELSALERASVEGHLKECANCRFAHEQEAVLKDRVRSAAAGLAAPVELREKILRDRRAFPPEVVPDQGRQSWARVFTRPVFALAFLVLLLLPALYLLRPRGLSLALAAIDTHDKILRRELPVISGDSPEALRESLIRAVAGEFAPMGYDLSMMNLKPVAGTVQVVDGRRVLVALYQGEGGALTCYTFPGAESDAPPEAQVFFDEDKKTTFYSYSDGRINAVLHREGRLICILVSAMPMPELLALARSKAGPPILSGCYLLTIGGAFTTDCSNKLPLHGPIPPLAALSAAVNLKRWG